VRVPPQPSCRTQRDLVWFHCGRCIAGHGYALSRMTGFCRRSRPDNACRVWLILPRNDAHLPRSVDGVPCENSESVVSEIWQGWLAGEIDRQVAAWFCAPTRVRRRRQLQLGSHNCPQVARVLQSLSPHFRA
jgi:hypothetical protein